MHWIRTSLSVAIAVSMPLVLIAADTTSAARWDFDNAEIADVITSGSVLRDQPGPQPPEFPDFTPNNSAIKLDGSGARLEIPDPGPNSLFDFTNGDEITIEAWVKPEAPINASPIYLIGKGRTNIPKFARDNQNWGLRLVGNGDLLKLSFVFASKLNGKTGWHRWTSSMGLQATAGWHHVCVTYRFGEPNSIRGFIDGRPTNGTWDLAGPTKNPPVVDDDDVWIGSSMGGSSANSFRGWLDSVAVHRSALDAQTIANRFHRVGGPRIVGPQPEVMPDLGDLPPGRVQITLAEEFPTHTRWLNEGETWPIATVKWTADEFLLPRIPLRFDEWGIRESWNAPVLLRMAADVELAPGKNHFLVRARALGRLWVDGKLIARTEPITRQPPNGEEPITPLTEPPLPGLRPAGYHQQEVLASVDIQPEENSSRQLHRVVLELVVGGKNLRTETGEVCVARLSSNGNIYEILQPSAEKHPLSLTDTAILTALARIEDSLNRLDDQTRHQAAASQNAFWEMRHQVAQKWASQHPAPKVPQSPEEITQHPIDAFIAAKINTAMSESEKSNPAQTRHFHENVLPILQEHCFRCHGDKNKGGLKLNNRVAALTPGDSEVAAVVPGDPENSELVARIRSNDDGLRMPPTGAGLDAEQIANLEKWIADGALWPALPISEADIADAPILDDESFLRRVYFDTIGIPPTATEVREFLSNRQPDKRNRIIAQLLDDERFADHRVSYWLDLLAENPTLLNASLNSTGPFRWFLYDSLRDRKPLDRMVTELLMMRGSPHEGGSAGFAIAAENDSPFAAKGHIVASAFLGIELQCARCHDSPYHSTTQRDLYSLAAMFSRKSVTVPSTSRVPKAFFEKQKSREALIQATLKPDEPVAADWPFAETTGAIDGPGIDLLMQTPNDSRERLAALITTPHNRRFSQVIVNRLWKQLLGAGIVEPVHDWEGREPSHPELLDWLAHQLVSNGYDIRHVMRLIMTSKTYQRAPIGRNLQASADQRFFNAPDRRRLTAEQIVDALHAVTNNPIDVEELTFVHDGRRSVSNRLSLGHPTRAWMFGDLKNERDRPSLSLPRARIVVDVLEAFGWTGARQKPITNRETDPNVLQPGVLANGSLTSTLTRATYGSELAELAVRAASAEKLVEELFLRILSRPPSDSERVAFSQALAAGFDTRLIPADQVQAPVELPQLPLVTWFNHLRPDANTIQQELERRVRMGPPADPRLETPWREVYEDIVWSLINHREFVWLP